MKKLMIAIAVAVLGTFAHAGDSSSWTDAKGVTWEFNYTDAGHLASISGATGYSDTLSIPETVKVGGTAYRVDEIEPFAFSAADDSGFLKVKTVEIPDSVTLIGPFAFENCRGITSLITLGNALKTIRSDAFHGCSGLEEVIIHSSVTQIDSYAFNGCSKLADVTFDGEPQKINMVASSFIGTPYLARVNANDKFADAITITGTEGFAKGCNVLASAETGEPDDHDGGVNRSVWWKWKAPSGVTAAAFHTFASSFDTVIGVYTGTSVNALTEVAFNDDRLGGEGLSFAKCAVTPGQTYYIRVAGYGQYCGDINLFWKAADGFSCVDVDGLMVGFTGTCPENVTIPETITWIMKGAFDGSEAEGENLDSFKRVTIPESVAGIQERAFTHCHKLTTVTLNTGLQVLDYAAFDSCYSLAGKTIYLPWTLEDVTGEAFYECDGALTVRASEDLSDQLNDGTYGDYCPTELTVSYYTPPAGGITTVTLYPEEGDFGLGVPLYGDRSTNLRLPQGVAAWNNAISRKPTRPGYAFGGFWAAGKAQLVWDENMKFKGNSTYWTSDGKWKYNDVTLDVHAVWDRLTCTVTFDANGGTVDPATKTVQGADVVGSLPTPTRGGFTFNGWYTAKVAGRVVKPTDVVTGDVTYYAMWTPKKYKLSYVANGGKVSPAYKMLDYCAKYGTLPTPTWAGHDFNGWFTAKTGGTKVTSSTKCTGNATIHAQWTIKQYKLSYSANGGTVSPTSKMVDYCATYGTLPTPTWAGHTFNGWFTARTGGSKVTSSTKCTGNATIYARWTVNQYKLTYNANGGTVSPVSKMVNYCATYGTLPTPTWGGHTFNGWFTARTGGSKVASSTKCTGNATIYARWTVKQYTVTFNANGGTVSPASQKVNYCATYTLPTPSWSGHTFQGWYTAASGGTKVTSPAKCTGNATLYAHWK